MATVLYGLYTPGTGEFTVSSAAPSRRCWRRQADREDLLPLRPDPPIGVADDPPRRSVTAVIPPGALLCCFTDGLVERRNQMIDHGIGKLAAILDEKLTAGRGSTNVPPAEDACIAVMRALIGNAPATDDIAILMLNRHPSQAPAAKRPS